MAKWPLRGRDVTGDLVLPRFDCCVCPYIVCMVCWKYVVGVECASVCTLYIVSRMSK